VVRDLSVVICSISKAMKYRGTVYIPTMVSRDRHPADHLSIFAEMIAKEFNYKILCTDSLDIGQVEGDTLFTIKSPQVSYPKALKDISKLKQEIRFVSYLQDLNNTVLKESLERADLILYSYKEAFGGSFSEYRHKSLYFPTFVIPSERYFSIENEFNKRIKKCLVTGVTDGQWYPLRHKASLGSQEIFEVIPHPGHNIPVSELINDPKVYVRDKYARKLSEYVCSLTSTLKGKTKATTNWLVCKYFEIMASGTVLVANWCPEMDELGFVDMENYVKADTSNFETIVKDIIFNAHAYEDIAQAGREFTRTYHTIERRMETLRKLL